MFLQRGQTLHCSHLGLHPDSTVIHVKFILKLSGVTLKHILANTNNKTFFFQNAPQILKEGLCPSILTPSKACKPFHIFFYTRLCVILFIKYISVHLYFSHAEVFARSGDAEGRRGRDW